MNKQIPEIHKELCSLSSRISSTAYCNRIIFSFLWRGCYGHIEKARTTLVSCPGTLTKLRTLRFSCTLITYVMLSWLFSLTQQARRNCNFLHGLQKEEKFHFLIMAILQNIRVKSCKTLSCIQNPPLTAAWWALTSLNSLFPSTWWQR